MLTRRIIPCLDVKNGRVMKGRQFSGLRDCGCPVELAQRYADQGADEITFLDISATPDGHGAHLETITAVRKVVGIPLTTGGGVRSLDDAGSLLDAGADKVGVNTAAVRAPKLISDISRRFGAQCTVLAIDAARHGSGWEVVVHSGAERSGLDVRGWAVQAVELGAGEILLTSWDQDGTKHGYDLELLRAVSDIVSVPVIASGGASGPEDFLSALESGADAVLAASIFHEGAFTVSDVKRFLQTKGVQVRL